MRSMHLGQIVLLTDVTEVIRLMTFEFFVVRKVLSYSFNENPALSHFGRFFGIHIF